MMTLKRVLFILFSCAHLVLLSQHNILDNNNYLIPNIGQYAMGNEQGVKNTFAWINGSNIAYIHENGFDFYNPKKLGEDSLYRFEKIGMRLVGASKNTSISVENSDYYERYYNYQKQPGVKVVAANKVVYKLIYPKIDWLIETQDKSLKHSFLVQPGADINQIVLQWKGVKNLKKDPEGRGLIMESDLGIISETKPIFIQNGRAFPSDFIVNGFQVQFDIPKGIDPNKDYIIDPQIYWSTYYSGPQQTQGLSVDVDNDFNVYLAGTTLSNSSISTAGSHQPNFAGQNDAYLVKFDECGRRLWATYYGGNFNEQNIKVKVDGNNNVFMVGRTNSTANISTPGSFQPIKSAGFDMFFVKFNEDGLRLWATFFGGTGFELDGNLAIDANNDIYLAFSSNSPGLATPGAHESTFTNINGVLAKFNTNGNRLWSTYYGGITNSQTRALSVTTDPSNAVYMVGQTGATDAISTPGAFQVVKPSFGNSGFMVKFSAAGVRQWGTYIGGNGNNDGMTGVAASSNRVFVVGNAFSSNMATPGAFQATKIGFGFTGYLGCFDLNGARQWATYYGGAANDQLNAVAVDAGGNPIIIGNSNSPGLSTPNAIFTTNQGGQDAVVARFSSAGMYNWGTYLGGTGNEQGIDIAFGKQGTNSIYAAGSSLTFGTGTSPLGVFGFQNTSLGNQAGFLTKMPNGAIFQSIRAIQADTCVGGNITIDFIAGGFNAGNQIHIELSDANGDFTSPTIIGSLSTTGGAGVITGTFPLGLPSGTGYQVRLAGTAPNNVSRPWCDTLTILASFSDSIVVNGPLGVCSNDSLEMLVNIYPNATYQWFLNGIPQAGSNSNIFYTKVPGDYHVQINIPGTCPITSDTVSIIQFVGPNVSLSSFPVFCTNQSPYTFVEGSPPGGDYNGPGVINNQFDASGLTPGLYPITYTYADSNGCRDSATLNLIVIEGPRDTIALGLCSDEPLILPDGQVVNTPGTYTFIEIAQNGCDSVVTAIVSESAPIQKFMPNDTNLCLNESLYIEIPGFEGYLWSTGRTQFNEVLTRPGLYTLTVFDSLGCSLTDTLEITSICEPILYIPNAFSPNADRRNDVYKVQSTQELTYFQMIIFNRWGEVVFSTEDIDFEWDGLFKGEVCPQGLYPFRILYRYPDVKGRIFQKEERGNLYIIN